MEPIAFEDLNKIDLVDFLASIGIQPKKRKAWYYFYSSPLAGHPTDRSTFIVNRRSNRWRETTSKKSGALIDLAIQLYHCTIGELTTILRSAMPPAPQSESMQRPSNLPFIIIEHTHPIRSVYLERYLWNRRIPLHLARLYLLEAWYRQENKTYHALAFPNSAGGFELFDPNRAFRVPPYGPAIISYQSQDIAIFRDSLDLLTFAALFAGPVRKSPDFLVLNGPIPFPAVKQIMAPYSHVHLFLPNDGAGIAFGNQAAHTLQNCRDHRSLYTGYRTMNDWICRIGTAVGPIIPRSTAEAHNSALTTCYPPQLP